MAALEFHGGHDDRVAQALAIPLASEASGCASADQRPDVLGLLVSLADGYEVWGSTGFHQSLSLRFVKAAVSNAQKIRFMLANPVTNDYGQTIKHLFAKCAPITTTRLWFCCQCNNPHGLATPQCVQCNHIRCPYCNME